MPRKSNKPPPPVKHPHIAAAIREGLERKRIGVPELSEAIGLPRASPQVYQWVKGLFAPSPSHRKNLAKILGIPESDLMKRPGLTMNGEQPAPAVREVARKPIPDPAKQLSFVILDDGRARLQIDITGQLAHISHVLLTLMKEKIVSQADVEAKTQRNDPRAAEAMGGIS